MALRLALIQLGVSLLTALVFLAQGAQPATGAFAGGVVVSLGTALFATRLFATQAPGARAALLGFIVGTAVKWGVAIGGLVLLLGVLRLPALPVVVGFGAAQLMNLLAWRFWE